MKTENSQIKTELEALKREKKLYKPTILALQSKTEILQEAI